jgi:hypothetical protein
VWKNLRRRVNRKLNTSASRTNALERVQILEQFLFVAFDSCLLLVAGPFSGVSKRNSAGLVRCWASLVAAEANRRVKKTGIDRPTKMVEPQNPYGYVSPLLDGIWLRAPYLHNGSVPTLHDLLNPPNERPQTFHRGYDVFDPVKIGFREPPPRPTGPNGTSTEPHFLFDTREKGNGNQGHTYGTQLSSQDKEKLLEYLKTL